MSDQDDEMQILELPPNRFWIPIGQVKSVSLERAQWKKDSRFGILVNVAFDPQQKQNAPDNFFRPDRRRYIEVIFWTDFAKHPGDWVDVKGHHRPGVGGESQHIHMSPVNADAAVPGGTGRAVEHAFFPHDQRPDLPIDIVVGVLWRDPLTPLEGYFRFSDRSYGDPPVPSPVGKGLSLWQHQVHSKGRLVIQGGSLSKLPAQKRML